MRALVITVVSLFFIAGLAVAAEQEGTKSQKEKLSYSIGYDIGSNLKKQSIDVDPDSLVKGAKDALAGSKADMTDQEMRDTLTAFQKEFMAKRVEQMKQLAEKNKNDGEAFLAENKKKEGVVTLPSGLQYKVLTDGKGKSPQKTDKVKVNYKGTLIDGTEFDSSYKRGEPAVFEADKVIPGWTEALQLMKEGSKWQVFIPSDLAYGERGAGGVIGPNQTLIFEVELISIEKPETTK